MFSKQPTNKKHLYLRFLTNKRAAISIINHIISVFAKLEFKEAEVIEGLAIIISSTPRSENLIKYRFIFSQLPNRELKIKIYIIIQKKEMN